jgi:hypothetical protein
VKVTVTQRPYIMTSHGVSFPLSSEEAQRLLDAYPVESFSPNRVTLQVTAVTVGELRPATLGGGDAFEVQR